MSHWMFYVAIFAKCLMSSRHPPSIQNMSSCQMALFPTRFVPTRSSGCFSKTLLVPLMGVTFTYHLAHSSEVPIVIERDSSHRTVYSLATSTSISHMHSPAGRGQPQMRVSMRLRRAMTFVFLQGNTFLRMQVSLCSPNYLSLTVMCATTLQNGAVQV